MVVSMGKQDNAIVGGSVDPETLYTKQNCIGMFYAKR